jgi:hypothetical protein
MIEFEWDEEKNKANAIKHGINFEFAQRAFTDPKSIIRRDAEHSRFEERYYCIGKVDDDIVTVRFTYRNGKVRIFGAGYWRDGRKDYEEKNRIH